MAQKHPRTSESESTVNALDGERGKGHAAGILKSRHHGLVRAAARAPVEQLARTMGAAVGVYCGGTKFSPTGM